MSYSVVNKYHLASELYDSGHNEAPTKSELDELKTVVEAVQEGFREVYGHGANSKGYAWSGLGSFKAIEAEVFQGEAWNPRGGIHPCKRESPLRAERRRTR